MWRYLQLLLITLLLGTMGNAQSNDECFDCHDDPEFTIEKNGKEISLNVNPAQYERSAHHSLQCVECHIGFDPEAEPHKAHISPVDCSSCHKESVGVLKHRNNSPDITCASCHGDVHLPQDKAERVNRCGNCHPDGVDEYLRSEHGAAFQSGFAEAPTCFDCHIEHDRHQLPSAPSSPEREGQIELCLKCHLDSPGVRARMTHTGAFVADYEKSIHGRAFKSGNLKAAVCSDCHGAHNELKASNPNSMVNKFNISHTCGKCHTEISRKFNQSIHGIALAKGVTEAPTCTNCHGEHHILEPGNPASPVASQNISAEVCGPCHESVALSEKFGIASERFKAYSDSYHGLAVTFGEVKAANCASCHGVHNILPSSDPRSTTNKANLAKTCGKCHPGANENFARGKVHVIRTREGEKILYWISTIYLMLIVSIIGFMSLHNLLDWFKKMKETYRERYSAECQQLPAGRKTGLYLRMTLEERIQHWLLLLSFSTLVITGFMLKFPNAAWVELIRRVGGQSIFELRGFLHRSAAVVLILDSGYHLYYIIFTRRGRKFMKDVLFRRQDLKDMMLALGYNLGLHSARPRFARFNYIEKGEYWAVIWGTAIMSMTGIALWFENQFMGWFSKLFLDVCETIHYFEAWLAFLAILVWHLYYVIFNPDVYPMNFTWLTGKLTREEMEKEHPLELERMDKEMETYSPENSSGEEE